MTLTFILSMPGCGSWNGKWSGAGRLYAVTRTIGDRRAKQLLASQPFSYSWPDRWRASVEVKQIAGAALRQVKKQSSGFGGYDWMINSILLRGKIMADHEIDEEAA